MRSGCLDDTRDPMGLSKVVCALLGVVRTHM